MHRGTCGRVGPAIIVDSKDIPKQVITMNSKFCLRNLENDKLHVFTLVNPHEADIAQENCPFWLQLE
jgi:transcription elongation GreA/GreB family factor